MSFRTFPLETLKQRRGGKWRRFDADVIPCWVADMDFPLPPPIAACLQGAVEREEFGYPGKWWAQELCTVFSERMANRYAWQTKPEDVIVLTDVVQAIYIAVDRFTAPGDGVVVQPPLYPPFQTAVTDLGRELIRNPLINNQSGWHLDVDSLRQLVTPSTRIFALCNPHNPSGRVFTRSELEAIAEVVLEHDLLVIADEIHSDLVYSGHTHVPFATLSPDIAKRTMTFTSASKAFNTAGLRCALAHFGSPEMKARFDTIGPRIRGGLVAYGAEIHCIAWRECEQWLREALGYLQANRDTLVRFVAEHMPGVRCHSPQATYLAWLDFRDCELGEDPHEFFLREAKVGLSEGPPFGLPEGAHAARLNFATERSVLLEILTRMSDALSRHRNM